MPFFCLPSFIFRKKSHPLLKKRKMKHKRKRKTIDSIYSDEFSMHKYGKKTHDIFSNKDINYFQLKSGFRLFNLGNGCYSIWNMFAGPCALMYTGEMPYDVKYVTESLSFIVMVDARGWIQVLKFSFGFGTISEAMGLMRVSDKRITSVLHWSDPHSFVLISADRTFNVFDNHMNHIYRSARMATNIPFIRVCRSQRGIVDARVLQRDKASVEVCIFNKTEMIKKILTYILAYKLDINCFYALYDSTYALHINGSPPSETLDE